MSSTDEDINLPPITPNRRPAAAQTCIPCGGTGKRNYGGVIDDCPYCQKPAAAQTVTEQTFEPFFKRMSNGEYERPFDEWFNNHEIGLGAAIPAEARWWAARTAEAAWISRDAAFAALQQENESIRRVLGELVAASNEADALADEEVRIVMARTDATVKDFAQRKLAHLERWTKAWAEAIKVMEGGK